MIKTGTEYPGGVINNSYKIKRAGVLRPALIYLKAFAFIIAIYSCYRVYVSIAIFCPAALAMAIKPSKIVSTFVFPAVSVSLTKI